jgi:transposase-like protein
VSGLLSDLQRRGLPTPLLVVTDGHAGLKKALEAWAHVRVQRCTTHKGRNLEDACPVHARAELTRDYHRIIHADEGLAARAAYDAFVKKWTTLCPPVARSIEEAGLDLLTFYDFPKVMWKSFADHQPTRESQSRIPTPDQNAGLVRDRGCCDHVALRPGRVRPDRFAPDRWHEQLSVFLAKEWCPAA